MILPWAVYNKLNYDSWRLTLSGEIHLLHMIVKVSSGELSRQDLLNEASQLMAKDGLDYDRDFFARGKYYREVIAKYVSIYRQESIKQVITGLTDFWWRAGSIDASADWFRQSNGASCG